MLHPALERALADDLPEERDECRRLLATEQWGAYVTRHGWDPLSTFERIAPAMPDADYWWLLGAVWRHYDRVHQRLREWRRLFASPRPGREALMESQEERDALAALPAVVEVFRGFSHPGGQDGLAWTLSREQAVYFARGEVVIGVGPGFADAIHDAPEPTVAAASIPRERILAYFAREDEVIVPNFRGYRRQVVRV